MGGVAMKRDDLVRATLKRLKYETSQTLVRVAVSKPMLTNSHQGGSFCSAEKTESFASLSLFT